MLTNFLRIDRFDKIFQIFKKIQKSLKNSNILAKAIFAEFCKILPNYTNNFFSVQEVIEKLIQSFIVHFNKFNDSCIINLDLTSCGIIYSKLIKLNLVQFHLKSTITFNFSQIK